MSKDHVFEDYWSISASELGIIKKYRGINRLKCAALLKYYQIEGSFPEKYGDISDLGCKKLAVILDISNDIDLAYDFLDATGRRQRADVRVYCGFRASVQSDYDAVTLYLVEHGFNDLDVENTISQRLKQWFLTQKIERSTTLQEERIINAVRAKLEDKRYQYISDQLSDDHKQGLDTLLEIQAGETYAPLVLLKDDPGKPCLSSVFIELSKLDKINNLDSPPELFPHNWKKLRQTYRHRTAREPVRELRCHPSHIRYALIAAFCLERRENIMSLLHAELLYYFKKEESLLLQEYLFI